VRESQDAVPSSVGSSASGYVSKPINNTALQHQSDTRFSELGISPVTKRYGSFERTRLLC
jgi:hypothetical protein